MLKILHTADLHAGRPSPKELDTYRARERRREIDRSVFRIIEFAQNEKVQILLISGDFFEHFHQSSSWIQEVVDLFSSAPNLRIFISPGNHDPLLPDSLYRSVKWPKNVTVFSGGSFQEISLDKLGVSVYGLGWTSFSQRNWLLRGIRPRQKGNWRNILMIHGDVQQSVNQSIYLPIHPDDIRESCMDYVALGHIHNPSSDKLGNTVYSYPGSPEPLDIGDVGPRGAYLVTINEGEFGSRVEAEFVPLSLRQVHKIELNITGLETEERLKNAILDVKDASIRKQDIFVINLEGAVEPSFNPDLEVIEREISQEFYSVRLTSGYVPDYDLDVLLSPDATSLEARFVKHLDSTAERLLKEGDHRGARIAKLATFYGLDALRQGRILQRRRGR
jgi:exonuclease SbcD